MTADEPVVVAAIHPVRDFDEWKAVVTSYVEAATTDTRVLRRRIFRSADDPNEVMVLMELASMEDVKELMPSFLMRDLLDRAGVEVYPAVFVGVEVEELGRST